MDRHSPKRRMVSFGLFQADCEQRILTKGGLRIKLQDQPFQVLVMLLDRPGEVVTREEIRERLWTADTFVVFDDGLNTAIKKLRAALNDSADNPRFIETIPRRGYRFLAPVTTPVAIRGIETANAKKLHYPGLRAASQPRKSRPQQRVPRFRRTALERHGLGHELGRSSRFFLWRFVLLFCLASCSRAGCSRDVYSRAKKLHSLSYLSII